MSERKISIDIAEKEFVNWVMGKQGSDEKIKSNPEVANGIVELICEGRLILHEDHSCTYRLQWPIMKESGDKEVPHIEELKFKARLKVKHVRPFLKRIDSENRQELMYAYLCALCSIPASLIDEIDIIDANRLQAIVVFFIT